MSPRLSPEEREVARVARLAQSVAEAESPLAKFARVWEPERCTCGGNGNNPRCPVHG